MKNIASFLILASILFSAVAGQSLTPPVGYIFKIEGTAELKATSNSAPQRLNAKNYARKISPGQLLRAKKGFVYLRLCDYSLVVVSDTWYPVPALFCYRPPQENFQNIFGVGGRTRMLFNFLNGEKVDPDFYSTWNNLANYRPDNFPAILFPQSFNQISEIPTVVRLKTLKLKWVPVSERINMSIYLSGNESAVWERDGEGMFGAYDNDDLKDVLKKIADNYSQDYLEFRIRTASGLMSFSRFKILSTELEQKLQSQLNALAAEDEFLRHVDCAQIMEEYGLFADAATEYEKALKLSPKSEDLMVSAAWAYANAGNIVRSEQLRKKSAKNNE